MSAASPRMGETLTASSSGIADEDGLSNPTYSYQWIRNNGTTDSVIQDATSSTHRLTDDDVGKTIKVRASFTDDEGNSESLTSDATAVVAATAPGVPQHVRVTPHDSQALDVSWEAPASDGGSAVTGYKVQWKEATGSWGTPEEVSEAVVTGITHNIRRPDRGNGLLGQGVGQQRCGRRVCIGGAGRHTQGYHPSEPLDGHGERGGHDPHLRRSP